MLFLRENDLLGQGGGRGAQAERQKGGTEQTGGGMKHHRLGWNVGEHSGGLTKNGDERSRFCHAELIKQVFDANIACFSRIESKQK